MLVRPFIKCSNALCTSRSLWLSRAEVASSRSNTEGLIKIALAMAMRCRCPETKIVKIVKNVKMSKCNFLMTYLLTVAIHVRQHLSHTLEASRRTLKSWYQSIEFSVNDVLIQ